MPKGGLSPLAPTRTYVRISSSPPCTTLPAGQGDPDQLAFGSGSVIAPERGQGLGHGPLLSQGQPATEFPFDDLQVVPECCVMPPASFGRQHDPDTAPIA